MKKVKTLKELFSFSGFVAKHELQAQFGDPMVRIITLERQKKHLSVRVVLAITLLIMIPKRKKCGIAMRAVIAYIYALFSDV